MVSWVVQGLSVIITALKSDSWVNIVNSLSAASYSVSINLGGSTASRLDVGVGVGEEKIVINVDDLTAWAGLLGRIVDVKVVLDVALIGIIDVEAALVVDIVVSLVLENLVVGKGIIRAANILAGVVSIAATALEGVVVVLSDNVVSTADVSGVIESLSATALAVGNVSDGVFSANDSDV